MRVVGVEHQEVAAPGDAGAYVGPCEDFGYY